MTMPAQREATHANTAMTRTDVVRLLQEGGNPEQLDVSHRDLRGINLINSNLRGANLSQACLCEANLCGTNLSKADLHGADLCGADLSWASFGEASEDEQAKDRLWRRGALFRETTKGSVAGRFAKGAGRYALGFALGFLCMFGLQVLLLRLWLKRNKELGRVASGRGCV